MKFSEEIEKVTLPGIKSTLRVWSDDSHRPKFDLLCLKEEVIDLLASKEIKFHKHKRLDCSVESMAVSRAEL